MFAACDGGSGESTCRIQVQLAGAISWQSDSQDPACVIPFSGSTGVEMDFRPLLASIQQLVVELPGAKKDLTGPLPAQVKVRVPDGRMWSTAAGACTVTVESNSFVEQEQFAQHYQLAGRGECASAAMPAGAATGTVTIAPFTFRFPARFL